ncbi:MAG: hypothetical protein KBG40_02265 [Bacteroidales bacterium]|nr:hypothetical protein [Bacteroidales bacterium]
MKAANNNLSRLILIIVISAAIIFLLFRQRSPFGKSNSAFSIEEKAEITKVVFYEKDKKLVISQKEDEWVIDNKHEAREEAVHFLLQILKEMRVKSPVNPDTFEEEITKHNIEPVRVNVYTGRRLKRSFFVYRTDSNKYGNIMKMRAFSKPFIMYIPGYEIDIGQYFTADRLFWQPFTVFDILPSEIAEIKVEHSHDTASSFYITISEGNPSLFSGNGEIIAGWDSLKVIRYVSYFTYIPFESIETGLTAEKKKEITESEPAYRIKVKKKDGATVELNVWQRKKTDNNGKEIADTDRVWAKIESRDEILVMRYFDLDPVLKKLSYFISN